MRVGIFGGTFNPIHYGHLVAASEAYNAFALESVIFIPAARPPHKDDPEIIDVEYRYDMVNLAIQDDMRFAVSRIEIERGGRSYSVDTIKELENIYPEKDFYFIIGKDALAEIFTWKDIHELLQKIRFIAVTRGEFDCGEIKKKYSGRICCLDIPRVDISSTLIRQRVNKGKLIRYLVPGVVEEYIIKHGLYK